MSQRLPVRVRVPSRTGDRNVTVRTTLTLKRDGQFDTNEVVTILHMLPEHRRVKEIVSVPDLMEGGWTILNARTNEKCASVKPEN